MSLRFVHRSLASAALALASLGAYAATVSFESATPGTLLVGAQRYHESGFVLSQNDTGFIVIDGPAAYGGTPAAPSGNDTQFLGLFNGGSILLEAQSGEAFSLLSFDVSFIAAAPGAYDPGEVGGGLFVAYETATGIDGLDFFDLGVADAGGVFSFSRLITAGDLASSLLSVEFVPCAYEQGTCATGLSVAQFALDNLVIPAPPTLAMTALALAAAGLMRRRANPIQA